MANFFYKVTFVSCCDGTVIELQIQTSQVNSYLTIGNTYLYNGVEPSLINGKCYTYTVNTETTVNGYTTVPPVEDFTLQDNCQDPECQTCSGGNCVCPPGYEPNEAGDACVQTEIIPAIPPTELLFCGNNVGTDPQFGIEYFGSLNNYVWPLLTVPQNNNYVSTTNMTPIPNSGNNLLTGDAWTSISPAAQMSGAHTPIISPDFARPYPSPNPLGLPINSSPPGLTTSYPYPLYQSTITSGVLNYGQGPEVTPIAYTSFFPTFPQPFSTYFGQGYLGNKGVWNYQLGVNVENQWAGFIACLEPEVETTYLITAVGNNGIRVIIDGVLAVEIISGDGGTQALNLINTYEITLPAGLHSIRLECFNYSGSGGLAADIFECSYSQFAAVTTLAQLEALVRFSTFWKRARNMTIASTGSDVVTISGDVTKPSDVQGYFDSAGFPANAFVIEVLDSVTYRFNQNIPAGAYTGKLRFLFTASSDPDTAFSCPDGYVLGTCDGLICYKTTEVPCQEFDYYTLNDCCTNLPYEIEGEPLVLRFDGVCYDIGLCPEDLINLVITSISNESGIDITGCLKLVEITDNIPEQTTNFSTIIQEVETVPTCAECITNYRLVFCDPTIPSIDTFTDLSTVVGQNILVEVNGIQRCATVEQTNNCDNLVEVITQLETCSCEKCYILTNCIIEGVPPIIVTNDLAQYVGDTIYLCADNFPSNPTPPADPGVPFSIPGDSPIYKGKLINCCDSTDIRYVTNNFQGYLSVGVLVIPNIDSPSGGSTKCWIYEKTDEQSQPYYFADLTGAKYYQNCTVCNQQNPCTIYPEIGECYCYEVQESETCDGALTLTLPAIIESFDDCLECKTQKIPECYLIVDCEDNQNTLLIQNDLSAYVGKVIKIQYCDTCWTVLPPIQNCNGSIQTTIVASFDTCVECLPPPPEPESKLIPRRIPPGYTTPGCPPEYTEKVNCAFAKQALDKMSSIRYGINSCCEEDFDSQDIKKRLLDLKAINTATSELLPLICKCYRLQVTSGNVEFKYISCDGQLTYVTLGEDEDLSLLKVCAQTYPRPVCPEAGVVYSVIVENNCVNGTCL